MPALILLLCLALLCPASAEAGSYPSPGARSGVHLTLREARREIRYRIRELARRHRDKLNLYQVGRCVRHSARRVRCATYEDYDARADRESYICSGWVEVTELRDRYETRGRRIRCI